MHIFWGVKILKDEHYHIGQLNENNFVEGIPCEMRNHTSLCLPRMTRNRTLSYKKEMRRNKLWIYLWTCEIQSSSCKKEEVRSDNRLLVSGSSTYSIMSYALLLLFLCPAKFFFFPKYKNIENKANGVKKCFTHVQYQQITFSLTHDTFKNKPINST